MLNFRRMRISTKVVKHHMRLVVMGGARVGKSSLVSRFLYNSFAPDYKATVEDFHSSDCAMSGLPALTLDIVDTSGSFHFPAMQRLAMLSADAFILVFSLDDQASFDEVRRLREMILRRRGQGSSPTPPIIIVANKSDIRANRRTVDNVVAEAIVTCDWEHRYVEASAKEDRNVVAIFRQLMAQASHKYSSQPPLIKPRLRLINP